MREGERKREGGQRMIAENKPENPLDILVSPTPVKRSPIQL